MTVTYMYVHIFINLFTHVSNSINRISKKLIYLNLK